MKKSKRSLELSRVDILCIAVLIISTLFFFIRIYPIIFAVHDDMRNYTLVRRGILVENAIASAKNGRISHLWNHLLLGFPYILNKVWFYKLVSYVTTLFDLWTMWLLAWKHIDKHLAWITSASFMAFATINASHNLFIAYPFCHQLPLGFILLSIHFFLNWLEKRKTSAIVVSCLFYLMASMIYEAFLPFVLVYAMLVAVHDDKKSRSFGKYILHIICCILPHTITGAAYSIVYFTWRHFYPPFYAGTKLYLAEPVRTIEALLKYSFAMVPEYEAAYAIHGAVPASDILRSIGIVGLVKAVLITAAFVMFVKKYSEKINFKGKMFAFITCIFMPNVLIALSQQHLESSKRGVINYLSSLYSYPFLLIVTAGICCMVYAHFKNKNLRTLLLACAGAVVVLNSFTADYTNFYWCNYYGAQSVRYKNFDHAVASDEVTNCDSNWQIYAPDNMGIHKLSSYTIDYIRIYDDTPADSFVLTADKLKEDKNVLCMRSDPNYQLMILGEADDAFCSEEVTIATILPQEFNVVMHTKSGKEVVYSGITDDQTITAPDGDPFDMNVRVTLK